MTRESILAERDLMKYRTSVDGFRAYSGFDHGRGALHWILNLWRFSYPVSFAIKKWNTYMCLLKLLRMRLLLEYDVLCFNLPKRGSPAHSTGF